MPDPCGRDRGTVAAGAVREVLASCRSAVGGRVVGRARAYAPVVARIELSVLGPVRAHVDGTEVALPGRRPRLLLALLVADAGCTVPAGRLVDALWSGDGGRPVDPTNTLQQYVARVRRALSADDGGGRPSPLVTTPPGYRLDPDAARVDLVEAEATWLRLRDVAPAAAPDRMAADADRALASWSGPAFEEFADDAFLLPAVERARRLRLDLLELATAADEHAGRSHRLVARLEGRASDWEVREPLALALAAALVRVGRHPDAVAVAQAHRRALALRGLDPSAALVDLEGRVLAHRPLPRTAGLATDAGPAGTAELLRRLVALAPSAGEPPAPEDDAAWHLAVAETAARPEVAADAATWVGIHERHAAGYDRALGWAHAHRPELAADLALALARWWDWRGDRGRICHHLGTAVERLGPEGGDRTGMAAMWLAFAEGTGPRGRRHLEVALTTTTDPMRLAEVRCVESVLVRTTDPQRATAAARAAARTFETSGRPAELAYAHVASALALLAAGRPHEAADHADRAGAVYGALGDQRGQAWTSLLRHQLDGRRPSAALTGVARFAAAHDDRPTAAWARAVSRTDQPAGT